MNALDIRANNLFNRISELIEQSRRFAVNAVNVAEVRTRFKVGRYIFEDEQQGERATYGQQVLKNLSARLLEHYGNDWSYDTLKRCRFFYQAYTNTVIGATLLPQLKEIEESTESEKKTNWGNSVATIQSPRFTLTWSHYLILMRIENIEARSFYEIEATQQQWSVKQLKRQVGSSLYERLALSPTTTVRATSPTAGYSSINLANSPQLKQALFHKRPENEMLNDKNHRKHSYAAMGIGLPLDTVWCCLF